MNCPHCKREIDFFVVIKRSKPERAEYYRQRYLKSGRAKVRTSLDQDGKCIICGNIVEGTRWYCDDCRRSKRRETFRISQANKYKKRKAVA